MDKIAKALAARDDAFAEVAHVLFGDGADELIQKMSAEQKKQRRDKALQNTAIATNVVGGVAGPAALFSAYRGAKSNAGGIPRELANSATGASKSKPTRFGSTKAGKKVASGVRALNSPKGQKAKIAAGATGAGLVGLQAVNWGGDVLSAKLINEQKKKDSKVTKSSPDQADLNTGGKISYRLIARAGDKSKPVVKEKGKLVAIKVKEEAKGKVVKNEQLDVTWTGEFSKVDNDKRQVFGYASVTEVNGEPVVDRQGDYISMEELEKSAYNYVVKSRKGGDMHRRNGDLPYHGSDMIESFLITDEKIEKMGLPPETPRGWWVGFQVNDEELWGEVKKGNRTGFSVHGRGSRVSKVL